MSETVFINFRGGIIAPDTLYNIMVAIQRIGCPLYDLASASS